MGTNNMKIFFRHFKKQRGISTIKMAGLVLGMLSTMLILEYVFYERSFDEGHGENVYRIAYNRYGKEGLMWKTANFFIPAGTYLKNKYPEVEDYVTLRRAYDITLTYKNGADDNIAVNVAKSYYATNSLFSVFRYPIQSGNNNCLEKPNTVAISESAAQKFFGNADPIGRELKLNYRDVFTISAVFKDLPPNNHLKSDFFFSFQTFIAKKPQILTDWIGDNGHTYIKLKPETDFIAFQKKVFPLMIAENYSEQQNAKNQRDEIFLQPVRSIHLNSHLEYETEPPGNGKLVSILFIFSIFFLIIAWINFINLESAQSIERAREIGVRRANGSSRMILVQQFIRDALFFNLFCYLITIVLFLIIDPFYRSVTGIDNDIRVFGIGFWTLFSLLVVVGVMVSTIYPAIILSSFNPVEVLRGRFVTSRNSYSLRKALVTFQFILSILLIAGAIVTFKQVNFLIEKDFGVSCQSKLVVKAPKRAAFGDAYNAKMELLLDKMAQEPGVKNYTFCSDVPGQEIFGFFGGYPKGKTTNELNWFFCIQADHRFATCFDAKVKSGRSFREDDNPDARMLMINETALKRYGFPTADEAVGKVVIGSDQKEWQIIGVFNDFHYYSVKVAAVPTCFTLQNNQKKFVVLTLSPASGSDSDKVMSSAKKAYLDIFPDQPFDYFYLQDLVSNDLKPDKTFVAVFGLFSALALIIALIGIVGLLLIFTLQNMKEFGMRKVLGAETHNIFRNLANQFTTQLAVAILVGVPLAVYSLNRWITQSYISHIEMKAIYFIAPVLIVITALFSVLVWIALKTYRMNVIDVINYE